MVFLVLLVLLDHLDLLVRMDPMVKTEIKGKLVTKVTQVSLVRMLKMASKGHRVLLETRVREEILASQADAEGTERLGRMDQLETKERRVTQVGAAPTVLVVLRDHLALLVILSNAEIAPRTSPLIVGSVLQLLPRMIQKLKMPQRTKRQPTPKRIRIRLAIKRAPRNLLILLRRLPLSRSLLM